MAVGDEMNYNFRKGIQAIVYRRTSSTVEYLILHRILNWVGWEFPKGGLKPGENEVDVLKRELWEECGIIEQDILEINKLEYELIINYPKEMWEKAGYIGAKYRSFAVEVKSGIACTLENNADENEHDEFRWLTSSEIIKIVSPNLKNSIDMASKSIK